jgi:EpsI family protein
MNNKSFFIAVLILVICAIVGFNSYLPARFASPGKIKVSDFPMTIGEWSATEIPLSDRDYEILETKNLFVREYKNRKGESVYLYLIYSEDNRKASHPPEVCYLGSGITITDKSSIRISDSLIVNRLILEKSKVRQLVIYWFKAGSLYTDKYLKQQIKIVLNRIFGKPTSSALIRISTDIKNNDPDAALALVKSFFTKIAPLLETYLP